MASIWTVQQTVGGVTTTYLVDAQNPTGYAQIVEEAGAGTVQRTLTYGARPNAGYAPYRCPEPG
ncbi:MAG: hypothetical protein HC893_01835 [Chloroflexaceae bacterium]|nr:hypothetical protein [Chloroflexaceae bacterium]NJL32812.1 hypothetical protein [Chloroflexaceae bacterium]NJO05178.1 hypothetical protein [Chloroflexaceae bacterium]